MQMVVLVSHHGHKAYYYIDKVQALTRRKSCEMLKPSNRAYRASNYSIVAIMVLKEATEFASILTDLVTLQLIYKFHQSFPIAVDYSTL